MALKFEKTGALDYLGHLGPISGGKGDHKPDKVTAAYVVLGAVLLYKPKVWRNRVSILSILFY